MDRFDGLPSAILKNAGAVDHRIDAVEPWQPVARLGIAVQVGPNRRHLGETPPERLRVAHCADHLMAGLKQTGGQASADEAASPRHEHAHGNAPGIRFSSKLRQAG
jgi:hypothetical protein